jgi:hypothetical protein
MRVCEATSSFISISRSSISVAVLSVTTTRARSLWACGSGSSTPTNGARFVWFHHAGSILNATSGSARRQGSGQGRRKALQRAASGTATRTGQAAPAHRRPRGEIRRTHRAQPDQTSRVAGRPNRSPTRHDHRPHHPKNRDNLFILRGYLTIPRKAIQLLQQYRHF